MDHHRDRDQCARVRVLFGHWIPHITKPDGSGERLDLRLIAGKKMPAFGRFRASEPFDVLGFFGGRQFRFFPRVETDCQTYKIFARLHRERFEHAEQSRQSHRAKLRAIVIDQRQNDRFILEIFSKFDRPARLIAKLKAMFSEKRPIDGEDKVAPQVIEDFVFLLDTPQRDRPTIERGKHLIG